MSNLNNQTDVNEENNIVNSTPENAKKPFIKDLLEQIELVVVLFAIIIACFALIGRTCKVSGPSMENTLYDGEMLIISDLFYTPKKNDIIVFHETGDNYNEPIVKRIIGLPGDTVYIQYFSDTMQVTVVDKNGNKEVLEEEYIKYDAQRYYLPYSAYVEEGTVFVMGDNRNHSADSRSELIGLVDSRKILGKVVLRLTPFDRFGAVN